VTSAPDAVTAHVAASPADGARGFVARFDDVSFVYPNGTQALDRVSFDIEEGRVLAICGPSGCGKSSLLAVLAGIRDATGGKIEWSADPVAAGGRGTGRHPTSMVFQKDTVLPWLTVTQNVKLFHTLNRSRRAEAGEVVSELLGMAGLSGFADAYPYQLSGGMRRRVAFITAMAARPRLLLLDEPFSSLDEPTRVAIHQDVLDIIKRLGTTVVLVTHDLAEAASLSDRVLIMTNRPARIAADHAIPFGDDRTVLDLRQRPDFLEVYARLWQDLSLQIQRTKGEGRR
jgi:NitT/TauT family transport system ATP-binding protein